MQRTYGCHWLASPIVCDHSPLAIQMDFLGFMVIAYNINKTSSILNAWLVLLPRAAGSEEVNVRVNS